MSGSVLLPLTTKNGRDSKMYFKKKTAKNNNSKAQI